LIEEAGFQSGSDFSGKIADRFFPENRFAFEKEKSISDFFAEVFDRDRDRDGKKENAERFGSLAVILLTIIISKGRNTHERAFTPER